MHSSEGQPAGIAENQASSAFGSTGPIEDTGTQETISYVVKQIISGHEQSGASSSAVAPVTTLKDGTDAAVWNFLPKETKEWFTTAPCPPSLPTRDYDFASYTDDEMKMIQSKLVVVNIAKDLGVLHVDEQGNVVCPSPMRSGSIGLILRRLVKDYQSAHPARRARMEALVRHSLRAAPTLLAHVQTHGNDLGTRKRFTSTNGPVLKWPRFEAKMLEWLNEQQGDRRPVSKASFYQAAEKVLAEFGGQEGFPTRAPGRSWMNKFTRRENIEWGRTSNKVVKDALQCTVELAKAVITLRAHWYVVLAMNMNKKGEASVVPTGVPPLSRIFAVDDLPVSISRYVGKGSPCGVLSTPYLDQIRRDGLTGQRRVASITPVQCLDPSHASPPPILCLPRLAEEAAVSSTGKPPEAAERWAPDVIPCVLESASFVNPNFIDVLVAFRAWLRESGGYPDDADVFLLVDGRASHIGTHIQAKAHELRIFLVYVPASTATILNFQGGHVFKNFSALMSRMWDAVTNEMRNKGLLSSGSLNPVQEQVLLSHILSTLWPVVSMPKGKLLEAHVRTLCCMGLICPETTVSGMDEHSATPHDAGQPHICDVPEPTIAEWTIRFQQQNLSWGGLPKDIEKHVRAHRSPDIIAPDCMAGGVDMSMAATGVSPSGFDLCDDIKFEGNYTELYRVLSQYQHCGVAEGDAGEDLAGFNAGEDPSGVHAPPTKRARGRRMVGR